jgi:hypothetical protein
MIYLLLNTICRDKHNPRSQAASRLLGDFQRELEGKSDLRKSQIIRKVQQQNESQTAEGKSDFRIKVRLHS